MNATEGFSRRKRMNATEGFSRRKRMNATDGFSRKKTNQDYLQMIFVKNGVEIEEHVAT